MNRLNYCGSCWIVLCIAVISAAAALAQIQLNCLSVRFQSARTSSSELNYTLELTTDLSGATAANGELAPLPSGGTTSHASFFRLTGGALVEPANGSFFLDVPNLTDANANGVPDFFEVDLAVQSVTASGTFESSDQNGKITATWQRDANSKDGVCQVTLDAYKVTFTNKFEIQEFAGTLSYRNTAGETNVTASVSLTKKAQPSATFSGTMIFTKLGSGRVSLQTGGLRNQASLSLAYDGIDELERTGNRFAAPLNFNDGDLGTKVEDYVSWMVKIVDPTDANGNGIPDLSDDGGKRLPPVLSLSRSGNDLALSISGEIGKPHQVETTTALGQGSWNLVTSVTLTADPQTVLLRSPTNFSRTAFWRVKVTQAQ